MSKTFEALGHLQNYSDSSDKAHGELKSCQWQLTKSRRNVRSGILGVDSKTAYTAELLREELRAQIRVLDSAEPIDLVDEDSTTTKTKKSEAPQWKLQNLLSEMDEASAASAIEDSATSNETSGMRNRKGGLSVEQCKSSSWTMIEEEDLEDAKIIRADPIKLFGGYFPALELKVAQKHANECLNSYIEAANEAAKLLALMREVETKK